MVYANRPENVEKLEIKMRNIIRYISPDKISSCVNTVQSYTRLPVPGPYIFL